MNRKKLKQKIKKFIASVLVYALVLFVSIKVYDYFKNLSKSHFYTLVANIKKTDELKAAFNCETKKFEAADEQ